MIVAGQFSDDSSIATQFDDNTEWEQSHNRILNIITYAPPSTKRVVIEIEDAGVDAYDVTCSYIRNAAWGIIDTRLSSRAGLQVAIVFRTIYSSGEDAVDQWEGFPMAIEAVKEQIPQLMAKGMVTFGELYSLQGRILCLLTTLVVVMEDPPEEVKPGRKISY